MDLYTWDIGSDEYCSNPPGHEDYVSTIMSLICEKTVLLEADLPSGAGDEIAESFRVALPQWRKIVSLKAVRGSMLWSWDYMKTFIYRLVAMLNVVLWARTHYLLLSDDKLSKLLYTNEDESVIHSTLLYQRR